jgi:hypothetical protein
MHQARDDHIPSPEQAGSDQENLRWDAAHQEYRTTHAVPITNLAPRQAALVQRRTLPAQIDQPPPHLFRVRRGRSAR